MWRLEYPRLLRAFWGASLVVAGFLPLQAMAQKSAAHCDGLEGQVVAEGAAVPDTISTTKATDINVLPVKLLSGAAGGGKLRQVLAVVVVGPQISSIDEVTATNLKCTNDSILLTVKMIEGPVSTASAGPRRPIIELRLYVEKLEMTLTVNWLMYYNTPNGLVAVNHTDSPYQGYPVSLEKKIRIGSQN